MRSIFIRAPSRRVLRLMIVGRDEITPWGKDSKRSKRSGEMRRDEKAKVSVRGRLAKPQKAVAGRRQEIQETQWLAGQRQRGGCSEAH